VYTNNPFLTEQPDYCESDHYLIESVCNTQTSYLQNKQKFFCPNGCFDGRCIEGALPTTGAPPSAQGSSCTDSDGGADYAAAGTASYANNPEIGSQSDSCSDGNELNERVCNSQTDYRKNTQVVYCHNGCSGGACAPNPVLTTPYCDDSDGGNIAGTKGTAQALAPCIGQQNCYVLTSETDACDGSSLMEFYCSGVERRSKGATCQYGCANGACRPSPSQTQQSSGGGGGVPLEIYTPPAPAQNESAAKHLGCSDSDSGVDLSVSGSARDGEQAFTDECAPCGARSCVREAVCTDDEEAMLLTYECAAGCADGACIAVVSCSDSDGGESFVVAGTASVLADGTPQRTASDQCVLNGQAVVSCAGDGCLLDEMSCSGSDIHSTSYPCPSGCADGACVDSTCTDSDGGIAPRTRGSASALGALHYDACIDAEGRQVDRCSRCSVREYACTPEGTRFEDMPCPFGCSDGACTERTTDLATGNVVAGPLPLTAPKQDPQKILNQVRAINTDIEEGDVCTGCLLDDACVPEGVRLLGASDGPLFCGGGSMLAQKAAGSACSLDYECASNACAQGVCAGVAQATGDEGWFGIFTI
jgi:hypothetical protein